MSLGGTRYPDPRPPGPARPAGGRGVTLLDASGQQGRRGAQKGRDPCGEAPGGRAGPTAASSARNTRPNRAVGPGAPPRPRSDAASDHSSARTVGRPACSLLAGEGPPSPDLQSRLPVASGRPEESVHRAASRSCMWWVPCGGTPGKGCQPQPRRLQSWGLGLRRTDREAWLPLPLRPVSGEWRHAASGPCSVPAESVQITETWRVARMAGRVGSGLRNRFTSPPRHAR